MTIVYSLEALSSIFLKKEFNLNEISIDEIRNEKLKSIGNYDQRSDFFAYNEEKLKNKNLSPSFKFSRELLFLSDFENNIKNFIDYKVSLNQIVPFRGPLNKNSLGHNEAGKRELIINDKYGFKNNNNIYKKKIDIMLVGDSFAEGVPFNNADDIAGKIMSKSNLNVANYGVTGTGPFMSLAVIKEYGPYLKPKNIFYLFYEGNDLRDMMNEEKTILKNYLDDEFSQNLFNSLNEVKKFLDEYEKVFYKILPQKIYYEDKAIHKKIKKALPLKEKIKDFIELNTLKELLFTSSVFYKKKHKVNYLYLQKILEKMNTEVLKWNGNFYFVYLPSWTRYNNRYSLANYLQKSKIKNIVKKQNIMFVDIDKYFKSKNAGNVDAFNLGIYGHYTKRGYELISLKISDIIIK